MKDFHPESQKDSRSQLTQHKPIRSSPYREAELRISRALQMRQSELDLSGLQLKTLPDSIHGLKQLTQLELVGNLLTELPEVLAEFLNLRVLSLRRNQIGWLPPWIGRLRELRRLSVQDNRLLELPPSIGELLDLESLELNRNCLTELPSSIGHLKGLVTLDVRYNELTSLPNSIGDLSRLQQLFLRNNQLELLPDSIGNLTQLRQLSLVHNCLKKLPLSLRHLGELSQLLLHENSDLGLCAEVLGPTWSDISRRKLLPKPPSDILDYYFRICSAANSKPLLEAKLILVGRGGVGKTSLSKRLVGEAFNLREDATHGIRIREWPSILPRGDQVHLHVWDFGGQEIMHSTHQFFLSERSLYLVVLNGRQGGEEAELEYWLKYIESFGADSPVIVILNKVKSQPFSLNESRLLQDYRLSSGTSRIQAFMRTDCATEPDGFGTSELRTAILSAIDQMPDVRAAFPANWFAIKERLATMPQHYITYERFRDICRELGEHDSRSQDLLAGFLNDLGVALNYRNDPHLADKHVLNPYWVTSGVYAVITSRYLHDSLGELRLSDLPMLLDAAREDLQQAGLKPDDYPREMHAFLLGLMSKCELCIAYPDDNDRFLVPGLLPRSEPDLEGQFEFENCLEFQYRYGLLPEGVLPQFIVKTHALSQGQPRWRSGVILEFEGCRALVRADGSQNKIHISICGPPSGRRRLLAVIRHDFEQIHRRFRKLDPAERVPLPGYRKKTVKYRELLLRERKRIENIDVEIEDDILSFRVKDLLDGIDLDERRGEAAAGSSEQVRAPSHRDIYLFISYSHKDERFVEDLKTRLKILSQAGEISDTWYDRRIAPGQDWSDEIARNLNRADIVLLFWSDDFLASDYCYQNEMRCALERVLAGKTVVVPVFIRDGHCLTLLKSPDGFRPFKDLPSVSQMQGVPTDARPVYQWSDPDTYWRNVSEGIATVARIRRGLPA